MIQFFTISLCVSVIGILMLFVLKQIELSTGHVILSSARPKVNRFFKTCLLLIERVLPGLVREGIWAVLMRLRGLLTKTLARWILSFETMLKNILHVLREKFNPHHSRGEASAFLKEVGEYKKQLENETQEDRSLY
ncbi:MAG: hypothetical protein V4436_02945 [Patescibacteria group bacterium]